MTPPEHQFAGLAKQFEDAQKQTPQEAILSRISEALEAGEDITRLIPSLQAETAKLSAQSVVIPEHHIPFLLETFLAITPPDRPWIVEGFLARQEVTVIAAEPGAGKSSLLADLAVTYAAGEDDWLGLKLTGDNRKALIIDAENSLGQLIDLVGKHRNTNRASKTLSIKPGAALLIDTETDRLIMRKIIEDTKPALIVIDTLRRHLGSTSENDATGREGMGSVMRFVADLARDSNAAIVLIHHTNKGGERSNDQGLTRLSGSADIAGAASAVFGLARKRGENTPAKLWPMKVRGIHDEIKPMTIALVKVSAASLPPKITWNLQISDGKFDQDDDNVAAANALILWIGEHPGTHSKKDLIEAMRELGYRPSKTTAYRIINDLIETGDILAEDGRHTSP